MAQSDELRLIARAARMYYLDDLKQAEIARRLRVSQAGVSRLLKRARAEGVVRISVDAPTGTFPELEERLARRFGLSEVVVAECGEDREEQVLTRMGEAAARYLEATVQPGEVIGISSWSETLLRTVDNLDPGRRVQAARIVQILGGMGNPGVQRHATALTTRLARLTGAEPMLLATQGIAGSVEAREALVADPYVAATMGEFARLSMVLMGIGALEPSKLLADSGNVFTTEELEALARQHAVGDMCLHFFDEQGVAIRSPVEGRVIGITLEQLRSVPCVVAVAGGNRKHRALLGALRSGLIDVLVTDQFTADRLDRSE
ncbi:sugar-binding transcriptional regulator [Acetobacteraceae bacterium KSS8]|uniref:Sugar-binding transcriptional regulator n=1 Tax=Endosaccharibacter trunci TaxID=2812733 RepID=A0ABT1WE51_9PROT|nr:sugar-binding transcriptional regulator [Acetobacteraceae bacterium KSS8]